MTGHHHRSLMGGQDASLHAVHFYDDRDFICEAVADFLAEGRRLHEPLLMLSTPSHREAIAARLESRGVDFDEACRDGKAVYHDAAGLLSTFMADGMPDVNLFHEVMEEILGSITAAGAHRIRAFGEMVDLLCAEGNGEGALRLEALWNGLARTHRFSLLCAYAKRNLFREVNGGLYDRICATHTHVVGAD